MNKERELLEKSIEWMSHLITEWKDEPSADTLRLQLITDINAIKELLAQPEPEPDVWRVTKIISGKVEVHFYHFKPDEQAYKYYRVDELYLKRG